MSYRFVGVMVALLMAAPVWADRHERRVSPTAGEWRMEAVSSRSQPYRDRKAEYYQRAACASLRNYVQTFVAQPGSVPGEPFIPLNPVLISNCLQGWGTLFPLQYIAQKWSGRLPKSPATVEADAAQISDYQRQARKGMVPQPMSMSCPETEFEIPALEEQALKGNMQAVTQLYLMQRKGTYTPEAKVLSIFKQKGLQRMNCQDF